MLQGERETWGRFAVKAAVLCAMVFGTVRLAVANPGAAGGPTRSSLTVAGTLTRVSGATRVTFEFRRREGAEALCASTVTVTPGEGGAFSAEVPVGAPEATCPAGMFDGRDVEVRALVEGTTVADWAAVNPVPYARFADQAGVNSDCPAGYARDAAGSGAAVTVCARTIAGGRDEVVKVGVGGSAFWVDRYEARVVDRAGTRQYGLSAADYANLVANGQWAAGMRGTLLAVSRDGGAPSTYVTWFQASALCRAAGKSLMTRDEWFAAADGLVAGDPATALNGNVPGETRCNTGGTGRRATGGGAGCASSWGAQDMIGNVWEWTDEWYASVGQVTSAATQGRNMVLGRRVNDSRPLGPAYGNDVTDNVTSVVFNTEDDQIGVPSAALRGGDWASQTRGGVFALNLTSGPSNVSNNLGFRCVVRR